MQKNYFLILTFVLAIFLNACNTKIDDAYASVTSDGKYFFFNRIDLGESFEESEANIFWVDAQFIENLKDK